MRRLDLSRLVLSGKISSNRFQHQEGDNIGLAGCGLTEIVIAGYGTEVLPRERDFLILPDREDWRIVAKFTAG